MGSTVLEHIVRKIMLDSNAYDVVAADTTLKADIEALQTEGKLEAIHTHVEDGELALIPFDRDIGQAAAIRRRPVGTGVLLLDRGILDVDRFGTPESDALFEALQTGNPKHVEDGMIASTALMEGATLVTNDRRLANRLADLAPDLPVLNGEGLRGLVEQLKAE